MQDLRVLDIFCGAGGLADGFQKAGFQVEGADISDHAGKTFELNGTGSFVRVDLSRNLVDGNYGIVIGGPPCKPWSSVNIRKRGKNHRDYHLLSRYFEHIKHHLPKIFLLENVPPLANDQAYVKGIKELMKLKYSIMSSVVTYSDYGAPIRRHRFITFGIKDGDPSLFFDKLSEYKKPAKNVKDVIWELRDADQNEAMDHVWPKLKTIRKYQKYYETGKFGWYVLKWDEPAPSFGNVMKTYILHPDAFDGHEERVISVREALLIMGFDRSFQFPSGIGLGWRYQMVVDAVSPVFSNVAAKVTKEILDDE